MKLEMIYKDFQVYDPQRKVKSIQDKLHRIRINVKCARERFSDPKFKHFLDLVDANDGRTRIRWTLEDQERLVSIVEKHGVNLPKIYKEFEA